MSKLNLYRILVYLTLCWVRMLNVIIVGFVNYLNSGLVTLLLNISVFWKI